MTLSLVTMSGQVKSQIRKPVPLRWYPKQCHDSLASLTLETLSMKCRVFVNKKDIITGGTLLDEMHLRFNYDVYYESTQIKIGKFVADVRKSYIDFYIKQTQAGQSRKCLMSKDLLIKIVSHYNNTQHYFIKDDYQNTRFITVGDLIPLLKARNNINNNNLSISSQCTCWDIHLIILPICRNPWAELIDVIYDKIPFEMMGKNEIDHTSIEWNDFDKTIIQYIELYQQFGICNNTHNEAISREIKYQIASLLDDICFNYFWHRFCDKYTSLPMSVDITPLIDHLLYLHNTHSNQQSSSYNHKLFVQLYYYYICCKKVYLLQTSKRPLKVKLQLLDNSIDNLHKQVQSLTPGLKRDCYFYTQIHRVWGDEYFKKLFEQANELCQISCVDAGGKCLNYIFNQLMYDQIEKQDLRKNNITSLCDGKCLPDGPIRRFYNIPDSAPKQVLGHCVLFILQLIIMFMSYCNNLSINCYKRFRMIINGILKHYICTDESHIHENSIIDCEWQNIAQQLCEIGLFTIDSIVITHGIYLSTVEADNFDEICDKRSYTKQPLFVPKINDLNQRLTKIRETMKKRLQVSGFPNLNRMFPHVTYCCLMRSILIGSKFARYDDLSILHLHYHNIWNGTIYTSKYDQIDEVINSVLYLMTFSNVPYRFPSGRMFSFYTQRNKKIENNLSDLNEMEKIACELQLGCIVKRPFDKQFVDKKHVQRKCLLSKEFKLKKKILSWRNIALIRECYTCKRKNRKLKQCKNCKQYYFCSKKCQKIDWKQNVKHATNCKSIG